MLVLFRMTVQRKFDFEGFHNYILLDVTVKHELLRFGFCTFSGNKTKTGYPKLEYSSFPFIIILNEYIYAPHAATTLMKQYPTWYNALCDITPPFGTIPPCGIMPHLVQCPIWYNIPIRYNALYGTMPIAQYDTIAIQL